MRSTSRRWTWACSAAWASSLRATTSRPLVPLSSRWTMPGRSGSAPPPSKSPSSSTKVGPLCEGAGWTTIPAGLSTTASASSTWTMRSSSLISRLARVGEGEQQDAGGDADVGEVEGRPAADLDVVSDGVGAHAIGEVAQRPTGKQARRDPHAGTGRVAGEDVADDGERQSGDQDQPGAAAAGQAKSDATVVREGEFQRPEHLDVLAGRQVRLDRRLRRLVENDDEPAERAGEAPGAGGFAAHPSIRPTTTARRMKSRNTPRIGLRSSAKPPPPIGGRKRRKKLR